MPASVSRWLPLALIALAALWLRTHDLAARPMHADEANQAVKTGELLEHGRYAYDPHDHHGPTLYYAALPIAWLRGQPTLAALDETTLRLVPALAGTFAVILFGLLAAPLGRFPSLAAAAFLAVSPPAVYYSRYFVQETLLAAFTLAAIVFAAHWWRRGGLGAALAAGACLGLMQATKESAPLFLAAAAVALVFVRPPRPASPRLARDLTAAALAALLVAALFYSSFGMHFAGLRDAFATYFQSSHRLAGATGHEKPWWYYAQLFTWRRAGGLVFQQLAFTSLAAAGSALAFVLPARSRLLRGAAIYTLLVFAALSFTPYKTPWHAIHLVPGLALLAAGALAAMPRRWIGGLLAFMVLASLWPQTRLVAFLRPADERNPYAYVHSSTDVLRFRPLAEAALARLPGGIIRVISEEYWPLPWYLRGLDRVGYWTTPPADCDGALVIASSDLADMVRSRLHGAYRESLLGLRPGYICVVFTRTSSP